MSRKLKLGSLFDGIGGFPLAGEMAGIVPVWASEIEPFPIRVTEKRLPEMKHYGDVHGLNGADLEPVDIITFGSPCQDLSIAGKRSGLGGSRSGLFYEAVRVITEMRKNTNGKYPRWAVWENVPGACPLRMGRIFASSSKASSASKPPRQMFLCRKTDAGCTRARSWTTVILSPGESSTQRRVGASHKDGNVYLLSSILMDNVPERFSLSPKACQGILRRAEKRGKELPQVLKAALERQANA